MIGSLLRRGFSELLGRDSETHWGIDEYDVANQWLTSHHFEVRDGKIERSSGPFRYVWPAELDLMAEMAGMSLRERWSGWKREPFTSESRWQVSVWEKPSAQARLSGTRRDGTVRE